jgi:lysozyme family protein
MNFDIAINRVLSNEGGYVNHPDDPGGETKWGISKRSYPMLNIKDLTRDDAVEIYRHDFWIAGQMDKMPDAVAFNALDFAVNSGIQTALRKLQQAIGVADDGHIGPVTMSVMEKMSPHDLASKYIAARLKFMTQLKAWDTFGKGWANRIADNLVYSAEDID